jgi:hypothetical protein
MNERAESQRCRNNALLRVLLVFPRAESRLLLCTADGQSPGRSRFVGRGRTEELVERRVKSIHNVRPPNG